MLFKLSNLNSNFTLTLGYLNPALNNSALNYKNNSCTQFAGEDVGLWPFYNSYVKKRKLFTRKIFKLSNGFITTSAIKLCFMQRQGLYSLTFINFQENYQTAEISFYSYHVIPLYKTICNYFVNQLLPNLIPWPRLLERQLI